METEAGWQSLKDNRFSELNLNTISSVLPQPLSDYQTLEDLVTDLMEAGEKQKLLNLLKTISLKLYILCDSGFHVFWTEQAARDYVASNQDDPSTVEIYENGKRLAYP